MRFQVLERHVVGFELERDVIEEIAVVQIEPVVLLLPTERAVELQDLDRTRLRCARRERDRISSYVL